MGEGGRAALWGARILGGVHFVKVAVWSIFLAVFPAISLYRGLIFAALVLAVLGVLLDFAVFGSRMELVPEPVRKLVLAVLLVNHIGVFGLGLWVQSRPQSGGWERLPRTEDWNDTVLVKAEDRLVAMGGGGSGAEGTFVRASPNDGATFQDLDYQGGFGWVLLYDPSRGELLAVPREGEDLWVHSLAAGTWRRYDRPLGYCQRAAVKGGHVFLIVESQLFTTDEVRRGWREVREVGHCTDVVVSPDPEDKSVLVTQSRVLESRDGGATWADVSPSPNEMTHAEGAIGGGGYRYVFEGGLLASTFYVSEPGGPLERRELPDSDTRVLVANPKDGREVWAGTWGRGIYRSLDAGRTWSIMGLERAEVRALVVDFEAHRAYAPSAGLVLDRGLFARSYP